MYIWDRSRFGGDDLLDGLVLNIVVTIFLPMLSVWIEFECRDLGVFLYLR